MDEQNEEKVAPFDAELEIIKLQGRFRWLVSELEEFRQKDRSLSARISRLKLKGLEDMEDIEKDVDEGDRQDIRSQVEKLSLEDRARLVATLMDRE